MESLYRIPTGCPDPERPEEGLSPEECDGPLPSVPVGFGPGGECAVACAPGAADDCPRCSTCSTTVGGSPLFEKVGVQVRAFDLSGTTSQLNPGICRADCRFDPSDNGGCQDGYTCDVDENVCVERCIADSQCRLAFRDQRHYGVVAVMDGEATCDPSTGRCAWTPPAGAGFESPCETSADCQADVGVCTFSGRCTSFQCNIVDSRGAPLYPCPADALCVSHGGNGSAVCARPCRSAEDCLPGDACTTDPSLPGGWTGVCTRICYSDAECRPTEGCLKGVFSDLQGTCEATCAPGGVDCPAGDVCAQAPGESYGFCRALDALCKQDGDCFGGQACEVLGDDFHGRCVDGCAGDADCGPGAFCRAQPGSTAGVCRWPGGECSPFSLRWDTGEPVLPLRGDPQCLEGEVCSAAVDGELGRCHVPGAADAGASMPDGGDAG